jgi:uncharacterized membrane protein YfcA
VLGNIRLPAALLLASSAAGAGGANIAISGVSAATAATAHVRAGRVNWHLVRWMAPPSVAGALVGGYLAGVVPQNALLLVIAGVLIYSGLDLLRRKPQPRRPGAELDVRAAIVAGLVIGLLGGFVGLILGTLRLPALLRLVGETPARAVGTNLVVGVFVGVAGLVGHLPSAAPDWDLLAVGAAASIPGALIGARLTGRLSEERLVQAVAVILLVAGATAAGQALF